MVRYGDWKLNYYHRQPTQLFNLKEDPNELHDRSDDPECHDILMVLIEKVLNGWNPDQIAAQMESKRADTHVLGRWARNTHPADKYRWNLLPEMDYLD